MNTEKFVAPTMKEALARVKEVLGEDAMILKSEKVRGGGPLNFLKQDLIEITAASAEEMKDDLQIGPDFAETLDGTMTKQQDESLSPRQRMEINLLKDEIKNLRDELLSVSKHIKYKTLPALPEELSRSWEQVRRAGLDSKWATEIAQEALVRLGPNELISAEAIQNYLIAQLSHAVQPASVNIARRKNPYKIALVGPPGAGKTTLIQKLAADPAAYGKKNIGLLTVDTQRMAGIEQLKAFARIAGAELEVVFQPDQVEKALERLQSREIILIDTAGVSPFDDQKLENLGSFLTALDPDEIQLVLNSTTRDEELNLTCARFRAMRISHLSFTCLDESLRRGYLMNIARYAQKPVAWLGSGQNVIGSVARYNVDTLRDWLQPESLEAPTVMQLLDAAE